MRRLPLLLLPVVCVACPGGTTGPFASECDRDALIVLSDELRSQAPRDAVNAVWPGLDAACGDALTGAARITYDHATPVPDQRDTALVRVPPLDRKYQKMTKAACPEWKEVAEVVANVPASERGTVAYEGCKFERYGLISAEQARSTSPNMVTWGMHQWFLDQGLTPEQARPISRALYALEQRSNWLIQPLPGQAWPEAPGDAIVEGIPVSISSAELIFNEEKLESLENGSLSASATRNHLVSSLYDSLAEEADKSKMMAEARGEQWNGRLIIAADAHTPMATIVDVMYTGGRAEFSSYSFVVQEASAFDVAQIPIAPPSFAVVEAGGVPRRPTPSPASTDDDSENRFVGYMHVPDEIADDEPPPEDVDEPDRYSSGNRQRGEEGKMGKPTSKSKSGLYAMKGPKDAIPQMARNFDPNMAGLAAAAKPDETPLLSIEITRDGITLSQGAEHRDEPKIEIASGDFPAIGRFAQSFKKANKDAHRVAISAAPDVELQEMLGALGAARGKGCDMEVDTCLLPDVVLLSDGAHGYRSTYRVYTAQPATGAYAVGGDDDDVWGGLTGAEIDEAYGVGGLGLVGGGGPETPAIGEGASHTFGGRGKRVPRVRQAKATVTGDLDKDIIRRIVRAHINEIRSCYGQGLTKNAELEGRLVINFVVTSTGKVGSSVVQESSLKDKNVANCVAKAVKRWKFPRPKNGGNVVVNYPFVLSPG